MAVNHGDGTSPLLQATTEFQGKGSKVKVGAGGAGRDPGSGPAPQVNQLMRHKASASLAMTEMGLMRMEV